MRISIALALAIFVAMTNTRQIHADEERHHGSGGGGGHHGHDHGSGGGIHGSGFGSGMNEGGDGNVNGTSPPSPDDKAATARWLAHNTDWCSLSTINSRERKGSPFANIASFSDGAKNNSTGSLYMLHSSLDASIIDVMHNSLISLSVSEMQTGYCQRKTYDAEDPRCARLSVNGRLVQVSDDEIEDAKVALFDRHPAMKDWYESGMGHDFRFWKVDIEEIWLVDFFGGAAKIKLDDWNRGTDDEGGPLLPTSMTLKREEEESTAAEAKHPSFVLVAIGISVAIALGFLVGRITGSTGLATTAFDRVEVAPEEDKVQWAVHA